MESKSIKKVSEAEPRAEEPKDLFDLVDIVDHSMRKIAFVREFFSHNVPDDELFSENARAGFHFIMDNIEDDLDAVATDLLKIHASKDPEKIGGELSAVEAASKK